MTAESWPAIGRRRKCGRCVGWATVACPFCDGSGFRTVYEDAPEGSVLLTPTEAWHLGRLIEEWVPGDVRDVGPATSALLSKFGIEIEAPG
jgi:hypothetical protein